VSLKASVNDYFEQNRLSRHANAAMVVKTLILVALYFGSYGLIVSGLLPLPVDVVVVLRHGHRHSRHRLFGHPRRPARGLLGEPARQPPDRLLLQ
jgi:hypothetical protein